jgi:hypothetical protein
MRKFIVQALVAAEISDAYGCANLSMPGLDARMWRRYALDVVKHSKKKSGILVIRRMTRAHICGLVSYRCEIDLHAGPVLQAYDLSAIDMLDPKPILSALLDSLTGLAHRSHCGMIRIVLPDREQDRTSLFAMLTQLRQHLVLEPRFDVDWTLHESAESVVFI